MTGGNPCLTATMRRPRSECPWAQKRKPVSMSGCLPTPGHRNRLADRSSEPFLTFPPSSWIG